MDKLNETLRNNAVALGLCEQWQRDWNTNWDYDKLVFKFYEGIDFCLSNRFPSNDFIKNHFPLNVLHKWNVIVDEKRSILNASEAAIFGSSDVTARYNARNCGRIHIKDEASLKITARNRSFVIAHILDKAAADAAMEKKKAINDAKDEIAEMAVAIAGKVVGREINDADQAKLVDHFVDELGDKA